jgi:ATP-dependent Zn protease
LFVSTAHKLPYAQVNTKFSDVKGCDEAVEELQDIVHVTKQLLCV